MAVRIVTPEERIAESNKRTTIALFGEFSVGKTSLLHTLDPDTTLALDFEGGFKSVQNWKGISIEIRSWSDLIDIVCYIGGVDPAVTKQEEKFSQAHYDYVAKIYGPVLNMAKFKTIFFDSLSEVASTCKVRAREKNIVYQKSGKGVLILDNATGLPIPAREPNGDMMIDNRGMYGDIANDVMSVVRHMQHCGKNIIWIGKLQKEVHEQTKLESWQPMLEGQAIGKQLPYVVDQVVTMAFFNYGVTGWEHVPGGQGAQHRAFVCQRTNPWGLPAKERTMGNIQMIEEPNLGKLIAKINQSAV